MGRKRNELVPIGEVFSDLYDGPLKTLRETSPPGGAPLHSG